MYRAEGGGELVFIGPQPAHLNFSATAKAVVREIGADARLLKWFISANLNWPRFGGC